MSEPSSSPHRPGKMTGVKVFVKGLKLEAEIGVYDHEHGIRQPLIADVEMDIIAAGWERLAETVNYEVIAEKARRTAAEGHFQLVEHVDDQALHTVRQLGGEGLGQQDGRAQVGLHVRLPGLHGQGLDAVVAEHRGVVDQEGDGAQRLGRAADQGRGVELVGQFGRDRRGLAAQLADLGGHRLGFVRRAAMMDGDVVAGLGAGERQGPPDPARRAGDERGSAHGRSAQSKWPNSALLRMAITARKATMQRAATVDMGRS